METEGYGASRGRTDGVDNEDAYLVEEGLGLFVVCDGASERPAGGTASRTAIAALEDFVEIAQRSQGNGPLGTTFSSYRVAGEAVHAAMTAVLEASRQSELLRGMSTTISMLLVQGYRGAISHCGDSRVYLHRDGALHQLTLDHELTREIDLGDTAGDEPDIDTFALALKVGDTFFLCTDGAEDVVEDPIVLGKVRSTPPRVLARRIVAAAHQRNSECDATVVVVRVLDDKSPAWLLLSTSPKEFSYGHAVAYA